MKVRSHHLDSVQRKALASIRNQIVHTGQAPSVRKLAALLGYRSPRSAAVIINRLQEAGYLARRPNGELRLLRSPSETTDHARTVQVPLVGTAPCGAPLLATENIEATIPVSVGLARPPHRYFLLRTQGDSMTLAGIKDGGLVLVRQQSTAENGQIVVALIDDDATIKEYRRDDKVIMLLPRSRNPRHKPIILTRDFLVQGVVVASIPNV
ncbi:MAG: transcriptional repressor LexA [bacterium]